MMTLQDFLVEHAKFPFPPLAEDRSFDTIDMSCLDVELLTQERKAQEAVPDETLIPKLCKTLEDIIGDTPLPDGTEDPFRIDFWASSAIPYLWHHRARGSRLVYK